MTTLFSKKLILTNRYRRGRNSSTLFRKEKSKNKSARAHTADSGAQFFCFWVTLDIASRSPFEDFAFGATTDELQVRARKGHTVSEARARAEQI